jgi:Ca-activated chloride channel homolog
MFRASARWLPLGLPVALILPLQTTLEVDVDLVNVFLTVHDRDGSYVTGLEAEDFRVFEDDQLRTIEMFDTGENLPSSVGILIDNSGSSADTLNAVRSGVLEFSDGLEANDQIFVMSFGTEDRVIQDFGDDRSRLADALGALRSWGTSVFFDALDSGIRKIAGSANPRKALIVLSDGEDNRSDRTYLEVVRAAESNMVMLYFVGMGPRILVDTYTLQGLASMSGGRVYLMSGSDSPRRALEAIHLDLSRQYYLGYYSASVPGFHTIRVEVPGTDYTVRAREGYLVEPD